MKRQGRWWVIEGCIGYGIARLKAEQSGTLAPGVSLQWDSDIVKRET